MMSGSGLSSEPVNPGGNTHSAPSLSSAVPDASRSSQVFWSIGLYMLSPAMSVSVSVTPSRS